MKCPVCDKPLGRGKTVSFQDLARKTVRIYTCKSCDLEIWVDVGTGKPIKVKGKV